MQTLCSTLDYQTMVSTATTNISKEDCRILNKAAQAIFQKTKTEAQTTRMTANMSSVQIKANM